MGGKTATTTQSVAIPPEVMARYNAVNTRAENVAQQPFQQYGGEFVAPITPTQQLGIGQTIGASQMAQPFYGAATGLTMSGAGSVGALTPEQIAYYQNPYTNAVAAPTFEALRQQQSQEMQGATGNAIRSGAFGGDRSGLVAANLARQQQLGMAQAMAPIYQQGYQQAVQTAAGQQGVVAQDLARQLQAGQQLGGLGAAAQGAALQGAQAVTGAGTLEQQTQQAQDTAQYQQFLQERGYPFQVAQFLANIAMGTGALSGSTTTTTQPAPFFSDEREKTNIQKLGKGLYAYDYKADVAKARRDGTPMPPKRVGPMAQEIEKKKPGLVVDINDYKVVDPSRAERAYGGGLDAESMGGAVMEPGAFAPGGLVSDVDMRSILDMQKQFLGPYGQGGLYGGTPHGQVGGGRGIVPQASLPVSKLVTAGSIPALQRSGLSQAVEAAGTGEKLAGMAQKAYELAGKAKDFITPTTVIEDSGKGLGANSITDEWTRATGGLVPQRLASGGMPYGGDPLLQDVISEGKNEVRQLPKPGQPPGAPKGLGSDIMDAAKLGSSLYGLGSTASTAAAAAPEALTALMALLPFSDRRLKHNIDPVGETYDGQRIYRYDMGDGRTQLGLMAQEVAQRKPDAVGERNGFLTLDYDRATEDAVPRAYGGLVPRHGYATDGTVAPDEDWQALLPTPTPEEVYPYAREAAKKRGLNPDIVERVVRGEWGSGKAYSGDEGSSHGPLQLHYGDVSPGKLSGKGLGDAFTQRTGLDARNPETWPQQIDFGLDRMKELGLTPWRTTMEKLGLGRWAARGEGAPAETAAKPAAGLGAAKPIEATGLSPRYEGSRNPSRQGLSDRPGVLSETAENAPFRTLFGKAFEGVSPDKRAALTSENLWVPLLAGVGSMLASPSIRLPGAIGAGLIGGTKAYTDLQKQQAEVETAKSGIEKRGAETIRTEQETLLASLQNLPNGMAIIWTTQGPIPLGDYMKMKQSGRAPELIGRIPRNAEQVASERFPEAFKGQPGAAPATQKPAGTTGTEPGKKEAPPKAGKTEPAPGTAAPTTGAGEKPSTITPSGVFFDNKSRAEAEQERTTILNGGAGAELLKAASKDYTGRVLSSGTAARDTSRFLTELAENLGNAAKGKGLNAPGFGFNARAEVINALNTFSRALGGPEFGSAETIKQINEKISALQAAAATKSIGQESYAALALMKEAIANPKMSPRSFTKLAGDLLAQNQRMIDRYNHYEIYAKTSEATAGRAQTDFQRLHNDAKYNKEGDAISRMILNAPDLIKDFRSGVYDAKEIDDVFEKKYGLKGMSRYFVGGR